jgi:bifunctional non-homologous end joining protein LigD
MSRDPLRFIPFQLATSVDTPPEGSEWIHEVKHDGYRCQVLLERGQVRVVTRNGHDWTERYPSIVGAALDLECKSAIIDGEAIVQDGDGISDFESLSFAMRWRPNAIVLYAFDLMHLDGRDLRQQRLLERRSLLKALVGSNDKSRIQFSDEFTGDGAALFAACGRRGIEGIVSKLATCRYVSGRTKTWLKTKCFTESSFVVVGTDRDRKTGALRALLARANENGLDYAGTAFIALDDVARAEFLDVMGRLTTPKGLFEATRLSEVRWCLPNVTVRVKHLAASKTLRHATVRSMVG